MDSLVLLLAMSLTGQAGNAGAFELRNQTADQTVSVWVWSGATGAWLYNQKPILLRPKQATRLNLQAGTYRIHVKSDSNSTLNLDRTLASGEVDRLRIGEQGGGGGGASQQMRVFVVRDEYGNASTAIPPPMVMPRTSR